MLSLDKKTVLVIDDDELLQKELVEMFGRESFTVLQAVDGEDGLRQALENHPDIIILDILMPKMDGMTMLGKLRNDPWGKAVPVIVLTSVSPEQESAIKPILENQPSYYLIKSATPVEDVIAKTKELVGMV